MHTNTPAGAGPVDQLVRPGAEARNLPTPADLRNYADDAGQHGNHWVPIAPASLRGMADEIERLRGALAAIATHSASTLRTNSKDRGDWAEDVAFMGKLARGH